MRTLSTLFAGLGATLLSPVALAGHDTTLVIDNDFDGAAEVWIDGRYEGSVRGDARVGFDIRPGNRSVTVQRPSGYVLLATRVHVHPGRDVRLEVDAPPATLSVRNPGHDRLWLRVDGQSLALAPHATTAVRVESGDVELLVEARDHHGSHVVERRDLWVEPGAVQQVALRSGPSHGHGYASRPEPRPQPVVRVHTSACSMSAGPAVAWYDDDDDDDRDHDRDRDRDRDRDDRRR